MSESTPPFLHWDEAMEIVNSEKDPITQRLLSRVVGSITIHHMKQDIAPSEPIDLLFMFKILREVLGEHDRLRDTLDGRSVEEWGDDV